MQLKAKHGSASNTFIITGDIENQEKAQTIIIFPGGSIELARTSNNEYWAHIAVNHGQVSEDMGTQNHKHGDVVDSRVDRDYPHGGTEIPDLKSIQHLAIRIKTAN